jgi:hypothetical protein
VWRRYCGIAITRSPKIARISIPKIMFTTGLPCISRAATSAAPRVCLAVMALIPNPVQHRGPAREDRLRGRPAREGFGMESMASADRARVHIGLGWCQKWSVFPAKFRHRSTKISA